jgi:hypothetical protein
MPSGNAISVVLDDAEKIAEELCPPVASVPRVVGVLIKQVEQLAQSTTGKELEALAEEALGLKKTTEQETAERLAALEQENAALKGGGVAAEAQTLPTGTVSGKSTVELTDAQKMEAQAARIAQLEGELDAATEPAKDTTGAGA